MKILRSLVVFAWITSVTSPARAQDDAALQAADRTTRTSQNEVNHARQDYLAAVQKSGVNSPEAGAAKTRLDATRHTWRQKLAARRTLRQNARGERVRRRTPPNH